MPPEAYYDLLAPRRGRPRPLGRPITCMCSKARTPCSNGSAAARSEPVPGCGSPSPSAEQFLAALGAKLRRAYPRRPDGKTLLPFRRLFPPWPALDARGPIG